MDWNTLYTWMEVATDFIRLLEFGCRITIIFGLIAAIVFFVWHRFARNSIREPANKQVCPTVFSENSSAGYTAMGFCGTGNLCDLTFVEDWQRFRYVMKTVRSRSNNRWLQHEAKVLRQLYESKQAEHYRAYLPWLVDQLSVRGRRSNVFEYREGFMTAEQILQYYPKGLAGQHLAWMYNRILEGIGFVHANGWVHGAVLPQHMMFHIENHGLQFVGWCQSVPLGTRLRMICKTFRNWYPPESQEQAATTPSTDIVLATRSMIHLAGGDPVTTWIPSHIPVAVQRFWKSCLYESPAMRPQDAWQLHEEFTDLLEAVYGPPRYHNLSLVNKGECNGWNSLV